MVSTQRIFNSIFGLLALFVVSCTAYQPIKPSNSPDNQVNQLNEGDKILVNMKDGTLYLMEYTESREGVLYGKGKRKTNQRLKEDPKELQLEITQIANLKTKKTSAVQTGILVSGIILGAAGVFALGTLAGWF